MRKNYSVDIKIDPDPMSFGFLDGTTLHETLDELERMMFRIAGENVPLFSSNRLQDLHADCAALLPKIGRLRARFQQLQAQADAVVFAAVAPPASISHWGPTEAFL